MKKVICRILASVMAISTLVGCGANNEAEEIKGIFYKVEKDGKSLYLAGTVHMGESNKRYKFSDEVNRAFDSADTVAFELDLNNINPEDTIPENTTYNSGDNLSNHISDEAKIHLEEVLDEVGTPYSKIEENQLWYIPSVVEQKQLEKSKFSANNGIDNILCKKANSEKKNVVGIETVEEQLALSITESEETEENLNKSIAELPKFDEVNEYYKSIVESVHNRDINKVNELNDKEKEKLERSEVGKRVYEELLPQRNEKMFKAIEEYIKEDKTYFVCVGAGHVVAGEESILNKLKAAGYTVTEM